MRKIQRLSICDQLIDEMIHQIIIGDWFPGMKLPGEIELASSLSVSRNVMREALKILENFGILDAKNGIGTFVADNATENIQNMQFFYKLKENDSVEVLLELRLMIEPSAAYFAALRISEDGIAELNALSARLLKRYQDEPNYQDDFDLHKAIARFSGNPLCESFCSSALTQLQNSLYADFNRHASSKTKKDNHDTHIAIINAITTHNANLARHLMDQHIRSRIKLINPDFELSPHDR